MRAFRRDLRAGELTLIGAAIIVAVAAMSAVSLFVNRVERGLAQQGGALLAADLVVESPDPIPSAWDQLAAAHGLRVSRTLAFRSVIQHGDSLQLAEIKAVDARYPLRGALTVSSVLFGPAEDARGIPGAGTAWADSRLLQALDIAPDHPVTVGAIPLEVSRVLVVEPDRGGELFSIAPRLLINLADVPATQLVLPGSRVSHRLLVAGNARALGAFRDEARTLIDGSVRLLGIRDARPEVRAALERAELFLGMAALSAVILAGVAIALAARHYAERHLDHAALMRCCGATQSFIVRVLCVELVSVALMAGVIGAASGYAAQFLLAHAFRGLLGGELPAPSLTALLAGIAIGSAVLIGFALAPLLSLKDVPPARMLRRDLRPLNRPGWLSYALPIAAVSALAPWQAQDARLAGYVIGGGAATMMALAGAAWIGVRGFGALRARVGVGWRYGLANIARRAGASSVQIVALGVGIMVMLLVTLVRSDLLAGWQGTIPARAPNHFVINIPLAEVEPLKTFLSARGLKAEGVYPMVRGRLALVNGRPVRPEQYPDARAQRLAEREFNLSWSAGLQADNTISAGRWWDNDPAAAPQFSVETGIAETLGLRLGDELTWQIIDRSVTAPITSLREVQWDSFNVNFFVIAPPGVLETFPATWITSFHVDDRHKGVLNELVRRFPSVIVIDVAALMQQVRLIIERVSGAVQYVFLFTLAAGILVLIAAMQTTQSERARESALLKVLGAVRATVARGLTAEFAMLGLTAGLLAAAAATLIGWLLAQRVFNVIFLWDPWVWVAGVCGGVAGVALCGIAGLRGALNEPPVSVLRRFN